MTKKEFDKLKVDLEKKISELNELQKKYRKETGHDFVPPFRLSKDEMDGYWDWCISTSNEALGL